MSTPRALLSIRDELAQKVAEGQIDRNEAIADLRAAVTEYPEQLDKLADDWADTQIDRAVKRYVLRRNKNASAENARRLAELGMEQPTLDGSPIPISQLDPSYKVTLDDHADYVKTNLASAWRLVKSFEDREEDHELLKQAVDGNGSLTREQALNVFKDLPEARRLALRAHVRTMLSLERRLFLQRRYRDLGSAAEG